MSRQQPPHDRPPRPERSERPRKEEAPQLTRHHYNAPVICGIVVFAMFAFYLSLVVVTQAADSFLPGTDVGVPYAELLPGVDSGEAEVGDRINILFLGLDIRRDEPDDMPARTDSVMVMTLDPATETGGVFSIPRDTWVEIPDGYGGYINDRINVAYELGEYQYEGYGGGGAALAMATVDHNFGIEIDHYVLLNMNNFVDLIDELDGIEVDVPEFAYDYAYTDCQYCGDVYPVEFYPGPEHMDGTRALAYARIRASDNDFKRIERQQVVIRATARRATDLGVLIESNPLDLYNQYKDAVKTDVNSLLAAGLAKLANDIGPERIRTISMAEATYPCYEACGGASVLLWDTKKVDALLTQFFSDGRLFGDGARVEVLNGTQTPDLAAEFGAFLSRQGMSPSQITTDELIGGPLYNSTIIVNLGAADNYTTTKLAEWLQLPSTRIKVSADPAAAEFLDRDATIIVVLGSDVSFPDEETANSSLEDSEAAGG